MAPLWAESASPILDVTRESVGKTGSRAAAKGKLTLADRPYIEIEYCRRCRWLLRSAWMAQELLATFEEQLGGVTLVPNAEGGVFEVRLAGETIFSRKEAGRFPDIKELKQLVRDRVAPDRDLGHIDRSSRPAEDVLEEKELDEAIPAVENRSRQRNSRKPRD